MLNLFFNFITRNRSKQLKISAVPYANWVLVVLCRKITMLTLKSEGGNRKKGWAELLPESWKKCSRQAVQLPDFCLHCWRVKGLSPQDAWENRSLSQLPWVLNQRRGHTVLESLVECRPQCPTWKSYIQILVSYYTDLRPILIYTNTTRITALTYVSGYRFYTHLQLLHISTVIMNIYSYTINNSLLRKLAQTIVSWK